MHRPTDLNVFVWCSFDEATVRG